jgi:hypothetical protein
MVSGQVTRSHAFSRCVVDHEGEHSPVLDDAGLPCPLVSR